MVQTAEYSDEVQKTINIIGHKDNFFVSHIANLLKLAGCKIITLTQIPKSFISNNTNLVFSNLQLITKDVDELKNCKDNVIVVTAKNFSIHTISYFKQFTNANRNFKLFCITSTKYDTEALSKQLFEFIFNSQSNVYQVEAANITPSTPNTQVPATQNNAPGNSLLDLYINIVSKPQKIIFYIFITLVIIYTSFFVPLFASFAIVGLRAKGYNVDLELGQSLSTAAASIYQKTNTPYAVFGLSGKVNNLVNLNTSIYELLNAARQLKLESQTAASYILDKESDSQSKIESKLKNINELTHKIKQELNTVISLSPQNLIKYIQNSLPISIELLKKQLDTLTDVTENLPSVIGKSSQKTYVVYFANNFELRPGGGFIGSFAVVKFNRMQLQDFTIYDVYDADGQLKARIAPPEAISKYLSQPFYFLRDSAFTGDFTQNTIIAEDFLQKELNLTQIDGSALITTSAVLSLIKVIPTIELNDYGTSINASNAYITLQSQSEADFFEGSIQKKNFISKLYSELLFKLSEPKYALQAASSAYKSIKSKQIVLNFKDPFLQSIADKNFASGRQISPNCIKTDLANNCLATYIYPLHANLGVNKANAFTIEDYFINQKILADGTIQTNFKTQITNTSQKNLYPGGVYKDYYTINLNPDIQDVSVRIDNNLASNYELTQNEYTTVSTYLEIAEYSTKTIEVTFTQPQNISAGGTLQLIFQKQIGSKSSAIKYNLTPQPALKPKSSNIPLDVAGTLKYNSILNTDIFYYFNF